MFEEFPHFFNFIECSAASLSFILENMTMKSYKHLVLVVWFQHIIWGHCIDQYLSFVIKWTLLLMVCSKKPKEIARRWHAALIPDEEQRVRPRRCVIRWAGPDWGKTGRSPSNSHPSDNILALIDKEYARRLRSSLKAGARASIQSGKCLIVFFGFYWW